jgi:3-phenylpropionate/trans-cinnamate dioxygenase ferredoxin reductase subunit
MKSGGVAARPRTAPVLCCPGNRRLESSFTPQSDSAPHGGLNTDVLIVGGGHGGAQAAIALRQTGFAGSITMVSDESCPPYDRPSLSKDYLVGGKAFEQILLRPADFWAGQDIRLLLDQRVVRVDPAEHGATLASGAVIRYGRMIWSAGGAPRNLTCAGSDAAGVHRIRTRADTDRIRAELGGVAQVVVIGGGYIGLEAAAALRKLDKPVLLIEALDRVLARVAGGTISRFFEAEHRAHGVEIMLDAKIDCITHDDGRATGVRLQDGRHLAADMIVVGIGIVPAVEPLLSAGAAGSNGVDVDDLCRTSLPDIHAIGDCANHVNGFADHARIRLESVQNAGDQAMTVARAIVGERAPYRALPWFWSHQYDLRLQTVGISAGFDTEVVRGSPADRKFSVVYLRRGRVIAIDCINNTRDYVQGKRLVSEGLRPDPRLLADPAVALKDLCPQEAPAH